MAGSTLFPGALDSHTGGNPFGFQVVADLLGTSLVGAHSSAATTLTVASTTGWETRGVLTLRDPDPDSATVPEICTYTSKDGTHFLSVSRGQYGSVAKNWGSGVLVELAPTAVHHNDLAAAIIAAETKIGFSAAASPVDLAALDLILMGTASGRSKWQQLTIGSIPDGLITPVKTDPSVARQNLLTNPHFRHWKRGTGAFTAVNNYTADRWKITNLNAPATVSVTRIARTDTLYPGDFSMQVVTAGGGGFCFIGQSVKDLLPYLKGRTVTASIRCKSSVSGVFQLALTDGIGQGTSGYVSGTSFQTLTATRTISASATDVALSINFDSGGVNCTAEISEATLVVGAAAIPEFPPLPYAEDEARCQRYFEVLGGASASFAVYAHAGAATTYHTPVSFRDTKGGQPTMTKNGTWSVTNAGQPTITYVSTQGFCIALLASAAGLYGTEPNTSDDSITAEYNP
jgi:hypothetical protein